MKKIIIVLIIVILMAGCNKSISKGETKDVFNFTNDLENTINITSYTIYGRFFNIEGIIDKKDDLKLVLKNNQEEIEYEIFTEDKDDKIIFKTNKLINEGINLEKIKEGTYIVLLKNNDNYYNLINNTSYKKEYKYLKYYTVTRDNNNYEINIGFNKILDKEYLIITCEKVKLPNEIYDIVVDPGHGGKDSGAINNSYTESKINLEYSLLLKEKLESLGLKVKLSRESDISISNYGTDGRVSIPYKTKAKLLLSMHLNSATLNVREGGIEVYVPNKSNPDFAKSIADNIVNNTSTIYSKNSSCRIEKGVYLRTLTKSDLDSLENDALKNGYTPYEKATTSSTYYYMIRETGGTITDAYIDSRNPKKEGNPYYMSNHGCESYLVELGYLSSNTNLNILLKEKEKYISAIVKSIKQELEI